jgi:MFS transporter, YNFM family, putative membrane transport protein
MASMRLCDARVPALGASFGRAAVDRSSAITAFTIAYGLMQLVDDPLDDRYGQPRVIALATLACALGALAAVLSDSFAARVASHALMGASAAGIIALAMAWVGGQMAGRSRCSPVCSSSASH